VKVYHNEGFVLTLTEVDRCFPNPCNNGGICNTTGSNTFECTCSLGWNGTQCELSKFNLLLLAFI
jgi:Notch-like protein